VYIPHPITQKINYFYLLPGKVFIFYFSILFFGIIVFTFLFPRCFLTTHTQTRDTKATGLGKPEYKDICSYHTFCNSPSCCLSTEKGIKKNFEYKTYYKQGGNLETLIIKTSDEHLRTHKSNTRSSRFTCTFLEHPAL